MRPCRSASSVRRPRRRRCPGRRDFTGSVPRGMPRCPTPGGASKGRWRPPPGVELEVLRRPFRAAVEEVDRGFVGLEDEVVIPVVVQIQRDEIVERPLPHPYACSRPEHHPEPGLRLPARPQPARDVRHPVPVEVEALCALDAASAAKTAPIAVLQRGFRRDEELAETARGGVPCRGVLSVRPFMFLLLRDVRPSLRAAHRVCVHQ